MGLQVKGAIAIFVKNFCFDRLWIRLVTIQALHSICIVAKSPWIYRSDPIFQPFTLNYFMTCAGHHMYIRMFIRPCFEFAHCPLGVMGELKTRANKTSSTVYDHNYFFFFFWDWNFLETFGLICGTTCAPYLIWNVSKCVG